MVEAESLIALATVHERGGDPVAAGRHRLAARALLRDYDDPRAAELLRELAGGAARAPAAKGDPGPG